MANIKKPPEEIFVTYWSEVSWFSWYESSKLDQNPLPPWPGPVNLSQATPQQYQRKKGQFRTQKEWERREWWFK
jgi:hypothetical protein